MTLLPLAVAIIATASAQVLYRLFFLKREKIYLAAAIALFCLAPAMNYLALKNWTLGTVYMATGLTYVLVMMLAKWLLGETIGPRKAQAMLLIVGGVVIFNL